MGKHPGSFLANGPREQFTSRYADPNHPATSGSFLSLVTGGYVNPPPIPYILGIDRGGKSKGYYGIGGKRLANYKAQSECNSTSESEETLGQGQAMNHRAGMRMQGGGYGYGRGATVPGAIVEFGKRGVAKMLGWVSFVRMISKDDVLTRLIRTCYTS